MFASSPFEIIRRRKTLNWSGSFTSAYLAANSGTGAAVAGTETAPRGLALGAHATNGEALTLASAGNFKGFLTRRVVVGGLTAFERAIGGVVSPTPQGLEAPFTDGLEVTVEAAQTIECEAGGAENYFVTSGTGAITTGTPVGAQLSFSSGTGLWYQAQTGDVVRGTLDANNLTSSDGTSLRIRVELV